MFYQMHHAYTAHYSSGIIDKPWWQVLLALIVAFATALATHYFYERRKKRAQIVSACAALIGATRQLRRNHLGFVEYDTEFGRQQLIYSENKGRKYQSNDGKEDIYEEAASLAFSAATEAKSQAQIYQAHILDSQKEIDKSYFLLLGYSADARNDDKLKKALEGIISYRHVGVYKSYKDAKNDIEEAFKKPLEEIQTQCSAIMIDNTKSWLYHIEKQFNP